MFFVDTLLYYKGSSISKRPRQAGLSFFSIETILLSFTRKESSWDALEWTKTEPITRSFLHVDLEFLFEAERVIEKGHGVVLINTGEAETLFVTSFRFLFLSDGTRNIVPLATIPLAAIDKSSPDHRKRYENYCVWLSPSNKVETGHICCINEMYEANRLWLSGGLKICFLVP